MAYWSKRRAVVTGASGFIGSLLCAKLEGLGAEVIKIDRDRDVRDPKNLLPALKQGDVIFHLAALANPHYCRQHPSEALSVNAIGTLGVLEAAAQAKCSRVVLASTAYVYGTPIKLPIDENHPLQPSSPYSASKVAAETLCAYYSKFVGVETVVLRFFNIFGPKQSTDFLIPTITQQLEKGKIELKDFDSKRDYVYIEDALDALLLAGTEKKAAGEVFNIGSGKSTSAKEVAELVLKAAGKQMPIVKVSSSAFVIEIQELRADISKAQKKLGWTPKVSMEEGLRVILNSR